MRCEARVRLLGRSHLVVVIVVVVVIVIIVVLVIVLSRQDMHVGPDSDQEAA